MNKGGPAKNWCIGVTSSVAGDWSIQSSCKIENADRNLNALTKSNLKLTYSKKLNGAYFSPERGLLKKAGAPVNGNIIYSANKIKATVSVDLLGRPIICSKSLAQYTTC